MLDGLLPLVSSFLLHPSSILQGTEALSVIGTAGQLPDYRLTTDPFAGRPCGHQVLVQEAATGSWCRACRSPSRRKGLPAWCPSSYTTEAATTSSITRCFDCPSRAGSLEVSLTAPERRRFVFSEAAEPCLHGEYRWWDRLVGPGDLVFGITSSWSDGDPGEPDGDADSSSAALTREALITSSGGVAEAAHLNPA